MHITEILEKLCTADGIAGYEDEVRQAALDIVALSATFWCLKRVKTAVSLPSHSAPIWTRSASWFAT